MTGWALSVLETCSASILGGGGDKLDNQLTLSHPIGCKVVEGQGGALGSRCGGWVV